MNFSPRFSAKVIGIYGKIVGTLKVIGGRTFSGSENTTDKTCPLQAFKAETSASKISPNLKRFGPHWFGKTHRQDMPPASVQAETSASKISPNLKRFGSHWFGNTHRQNMLLQAFKARTSASKISPNLKRFGSH